MLRGIGRVKLQQDLRSSSGFEKIALVALPIPSDTAFLYKIPDDLCDKVKPGLLVEAPIKNKRALGVILEIREISREDKDREIKEILSLPDEEVVIPKSLLTMARWIERYYVSGISDTIRLFLPPRTFIRSSLQVRWTGDSITEALDERNQKIFEYIARKRRPWLSVAKIEKRLGFDPRDRLINMERDGLVVLREKPISTLKKERLPDITTEVHPLPSRPTDEQREALSRIERFIKDKKFKGFLLHGVPGSGKTAVYIWAIEKALKQGRSALVLVPEISLTVQMVRFFRRAFGNKVAVYHSGLTPSERFTLWKAVKRYEFQVILGARSAIFLPLKNLGIIVVDEEHDPTYKEKERVPSYHARDLALVRGRIENCPVVLGSATPSLESFYNAKIGKLKLLSMKKRVRGYKPPRIEVLDLRKEASSGILSIKLIESIQKSIERGKQVLLFLNRRGYAPHLLCLDCGYIPTCPECQVNLSFHKREKALICHLCGYQEPPPEMCPRCGSLRIIEVGYGTERAEEEIKSTFRGVNLQRMDLDTTRFKGSHERIYRAFKRGEIKILLGTQMVAQGFDFPEVDLVGVLLADIGLGLPDFRAEERVFQILTQVAGRVRRGGDVIIQTYSPESPAIRYILEGGYIEFQKEELKGREEFLYPPFTRMVILEARSKVFDKAKDYLENIKKRIEMAPNAQEIMINGPSPSPIVKVKGESRLRIILRTKRPYLIQDVLRKVYLRPPSGVTMKIDVDPINLL